MEIEGKKYAGHRYSASSFTIAPKYHTSFAHQHIEQLNGIHMLRKNVWNICGCEPPATPVV